MESKTCCFFGHRDTVVTRELRAQLFSTIEYLIENENVDTFLIGHQGNFDVAVLDCLIKLHKLYPHIFFSIVLPYLTAKKLKSEIMYEHSMFPEALENVHPRYAIDKRNRWMVDESDICLCYVNETWGGAYKFTLRAKKKGLKIINLGTAEL